VDKDVAVEIAKTLAQSSRERGVVLRVVGAIAFVMHCPSFCRLLEQMQRQITDVDLVGYARQEKQILAVLRDLGYQFEDFREMMRAGLESNRRMFRDPRHDAKVDVFLDRMEFCHTIDLRDRLEIDFPTISVSDLLLEKMQIVEINEKDIKDTIVLLREHGIGDVDSEAVNGGYVGGLLSDDWGFYYTVTTNLRKVRDFLPKYEMLSIEDRNDVAVKVQRLLQSIEDGPKSLKWKMRAKVGTKRIWYQRVEEIDPEEPMFKF